MTTVEDFLLHEIAQDGDRYIFGAEADFDNPNPDVFDCSELVQWAGRRLGLPIPDGSWIQYRYCRDNGTAFSVNEGVGTRGALLFKFSSDPNHGGRPSFAHVATSLGNGSTIEARGTKWGVGSWTADPNVRGWTHAGMVPGLDYTPSPQLAPDYPGRVLRLKRPMMQGEDVLQAQAQLITKGHGGYGFKADGWFGNITHAHTVEYQAEVGLDADGQIGPNTWAALWS